MNPSLFGPFLREERARKNMTQRELADNLNVSVSAVSKWERSKCLPDIEKINDIAEVLELTVLEVLACKRKPESESAKQELSAVYEKTIDTAHKQHLRIIRTSAIAAMCVVLFVIGIHFFPIYHIAQVWFPSYYDTGEISMLAYIGSSDDRDTAKGVMELAERAFSDTTSTDRGASEKYGLLSGYAITTNDGADAERHTLKLWSAHFYSSEGYMWIFYSQEGLDSNGEVVTGSWNVPALWRLEKNNFGEWEVVHVKEHP